jgi:hypothetical protein
MSTAEERRGWDTVVFDTEWNVFVVRMEAL